MRGKRVVLAFLSTSVSVTWIGVNSNNRFTERILTVHHQSILDPARFVIFWMLNQAVQLLSIHTPQRVQREVCGDNPLVRDLFDSMTIQFCVPGELRRWDGHRATGGHHLIGIALLYNQRIQGADRNGWKEDCYMSLSERGQQVQDYILQLICSTKNKNTQTHRSDLIFLSHY